MNAYGLFLAGFTIGSYASDVITWMPTYMDLSRQEKFYRDQLRNAQSFEEMRLIEIELKRIVHDKSAVALYLGVGIVRATWDLLSPSSSHANEINELRCQ
ncbi:hypothetical protein DSCA_25340 [Desulfosarcina alkanivorans]|uniref:Uncharacterized protein n=1 Tax=Desulfosarcina alkanivorans TaxID=571177 RepID=A0A5K7YQL7_9BACT|nr:hypothetical protein [Desulfosarcina alkanivorans]BBO68604.1 hypothetical protein DSCA_25340 [Desulfosarcina alkanivorans]